MKLSILFPAIVAVALSFSSATSVSAQCVSVRYCAPRPAVRCVPPARVMYYSRPAWCAPPARVVYYGNRHYAPRHRYYAGYRHPHHHGHHHGYRTHR